MSSGARAKVPRWNAPPSRREIIDEIDACRPPGSFISSSADRCPVADSHLSNRERREHFPFDARSEAAAKRAVRIRRRKAAGALVQPPDHDGSASGSQPEGTERRAAFRRDGSGFVRAQPEGLREGSGDHGRRRGPQDQRRETIRCSARISTTSPSSEHLPKKIPGCCSSEVTTWRSTSRSPANTAFSRPTLTGAQPALYTLNGKTVRPLGQESDKAFALLNALDESQRKQAISELPRGRSRARTRAGWQDHPARRPEGFRHERAATRHAARPDLGMGGHRSRKRGRGPHGRNQSRYRRDLVRVERSDNRYSGTATAQRTTGFRGRISSSSTRLSGWAAIRPCTSTPCTAIRRMTTAGSSRRNERASWLPPVRSAVGRNACARAPAG